MFLDRLMGRVFLVVIITAIIMGTKLVACQTGGFFFFFTRGALGNYKKKNKRGINHTVAG